MNSAFILICEGSAGFGGAGVSPAILRAMKIENRRRDAGATKRTAAAHWGECHPHCSDRREK